MTMLFLTFALMTLTLVSVPAVSAKTLKFNEVIYLPGPDPGKPYQPQPGPCAWSGPITGDITGTSYFWETTKNFVTGAEAKGGKVEHFFEDFLIIFSDGGWIVGYESQGIFLFAAKPDSAKYHAEGWITAASPDKQSFIGCKFFEEGIVYWVYDNPDVWAIGYGRGFIGP